MVTVQVTIEVRAIGQRTRSGEVTLRDISLTAGRGELVAIIGGSGSGKTTLLDAMSGSRPPSSGSVRRIQRNIGYVANGETIHDVLPLAKALRYRAALRGVRVRDDAVAEALRVAGLLGRDTALVGSLDAGQRRRAAIAAELLAASTVPSLLFLEEPGGGLDPAQSTEVMRLLRRLCDGGTTVVLTTSSPLDAARCDKVAVLATGGHLAFFGTAKAACGYFGADSLDEIYERLAGLGDPAAALSRRFFHFSGTAAGFTPAITAASPPGPAWRVPDSAGPHSAGRPGTGSFAGDEGGGLARTAQVDASPLAFADDDADGLPSIAAEQAFADSLAFDGTGLRARRAVARTVLSVRQSAVLTRRNADVLARSRPALVALATAPVAVLLAFAVLFGLGAFDPARPGPALLVVFGGFLVGLAYGLPQVHHERGLLRAERFLGLSSAAYVLAKAAVLIPVLAVADVVILALPDVLGRLPGYGPAFVTALLSSVVAYALGLLLSAALPASPGGLTPLAAGLPSILLAAALLALLDRPTWSDWLALLVAAAVLLAATTTLIARQFPSTFHLSRTGSGQR